MTNHQPVKNMRPEIIDTTRLRFSPNSIHSHLGHRQLSKNPDIFVQVSLMSHSKKCTSNEDSNKEIIQI
uniref:Uncharacterized protein n=1 Tax=Arion vulgaris TaxID=1028688 RepID=A0A0B6Z533_9EUPU